MRLHRIGIACLFAWLAAAPALPASAQAVYCDVYYKDANWRYSFWQLGNRYKYEPDEKETSLRTFENAIDLFHRKSKEAGLMMLSQAASTVSAGGAVPLQAVVASYMLHILLACPDMPLPDDF